jgi:hypothetical protein
MANEPELQRLLTEKNAEIAALSSVVNSLLDWAESVLGDPLTKWPPHNKPRCIWLEAWCREGSKKRWLQRQDPGLI